MQKIIHFFRNSWFLVLLGFLAVAILIWYVGPLLAIGGSAPLTSPVSRLLAMVFIGSSLALYRLKSTISTMRHNRQMVGELMGSARAGAGKEARDEAAVAAEKEIDILRQNFEEALAVLKKAKFDGRKGRRQYLYQLPWYLFIGPPGSGKTTALVNSGLHFPLGQQKIKGVGGTRHCDWWFTEEAVLLDTAGRYTTQDSEQAVDHAAWTGFLKLLKKYRPRRPINGVFIAVSLSDMMRQDMTERINQAEAIKQRIHELHEYLGIRFPVYVLFTKSDLVAGFREFFNHLGHEEREQVWGMTFPMDDGQDPQGAVGQFAAEFDALEQRLSQRVVKRLYEERVAPLRHQIYVFPQQFSSLKKIAEQFLNVLFRPSRYQKRPLLRGVYFTSGTQEGTPIDRLMGILASTFGLERQAPSPFTGKGKSYFLTRLFHEVIFPEAELVGANLGVERWRAWIQRGAYGGALIFTVLVASAWLVSYARNQSYVIGMEDYLQKVRTQIQALSPEKRELLDALPLLNAARHIPGGYGETGSPWLMGLGLYQGDKLGGQAYAVYQRLLNRAFLPRLLLQVEQRLHQETTDPTELYEALKVYLMMDDSRHYNADAIKGWMNKDWEQHLPRSVTKEQRSQLQAHLDALLASGPVSSPIVQDAKLIEHTRAVLAQLSPAQRAYGWLKQAYQGETIADFRISEAAGQFAPLVFRRPSGQSLNAGISGLYTYAGYYQFFNTHSRPLVDRLFNEQWVLGTSQTSPPEPEQRQQALAELCQLYLGDYAQHWKELLADIEIAPFANLGEASTILNVLAENDSPLGKLLAAVEKEISLQQTPDDKTSAKAGNSSVSASPPCDLTTYFAQLGGGLDSGKALTGELDEVLATLEELYVNINSMALLSESGDIPAHLKDQTNLVIVKLKREAMRSPAPLHDWLIAMGEDSARVMLSGIRTNVNAVWIKETLPFCREAINQRYPLVQGSSREITLEDFARFFGPNGIMDQFFQKYLQPYVDTGSDPWRWRASESGALEIPADVLAQFQHADAIKKAFFGSGGQTPSVKFQLKPVSMDPATGFFVLDLDGQQITQSPDFAYPSTLEWPGAGGSNQIRIQFFPASGSAPPVEVTRNGPWAWLRVLEQANLKATSQPERFTVTFRAGGHWAHYELNAVSLFNPFDMKALRQFQCPSRL
jgi:type VI secretion system protein ImpL